MDANPLDSINALKGQLWKKLIRKDELQEYQSKFKVISSRLSTGQMQITVQSLTTGWYLQSQRPWFIRCVFQHYSCWWDNLRKESNVLGNAILWIKIQAGQAIHLCLCSPLFLMSIWWYWSLQVYLPARKSWLQVRKAFAQFTFLHSFRHPWFPDDCYLICAAFSGNAISRIMNATCSRLSIPSRSVIWLLSRQICGHAIVLTFILLP